MTDRLTALEELKAKVEAGPVDPWPRRCETRISVVNGECEACGAYEGEACLKPRTAQEKVND